MQKDNRVIEYRYLNMKTQQFCKDGAELNRQIARSGGGKIVCIPSIEHNQILIAGGSHSINEYSAIFMCRKLSGLNRTGEALH